MTPWKLIDSAPVPGSKRVLSLYQRGKEFSIRVDGLELMNSSVHGSEEALAELACKKVAARPRVRLLIGGLGMGYTLSAALKALDAGSQIVVAELVPAVILWNRGPLAALTGHPLKDKRVTVLNADVIDIVASQARGFDAILLDVDNGPEGLTRDDNYHLYTKAGLTAAYEAIRPGGVLAVWSAGPSRDFTQRLRRTGFTTQEVRVRARSSRKGGKHTIWLAER